MCDTLLAKKYNVLSESLVTKWSNQLKQLDGAGIRNKKLTNNIS